ncbi:hypothetical protein AVEN_219481-1 [Araneus ventricosus]|uniref:RING-type domain-containing protein n=1 Tax=Araneus ventricosus TaxID=182803 RepID=A0A4Y2BQ02_ARAVE|nr:hypothetical protein AVEN_219481-1 [Araneus ventricosus]
MIPKIPLPDITGALAGVAGQFEILHNMRRLVRKCNLMKTRGAETGIRSKVKKRNLLSCLRAFQYSNIVTKSSTSLSQIRRIFVPQRPLIEEIQIPNTSYQLRRMSDLMLTNRLSSLVAHMWTTFISKNVKKDASVQDPSTSGEGRPPSVDTSTGYECTICLESTSRKEMKTLPCSHAFHEACIDVWLVENRRCPICRNEPVVVFRFFTLNVKRNSVSIDMRLTNGGIEISLDNDDFIRLNNRGIDMRYINNGSGRRTNDNIDIKLDNDGFIKLNDGGIQMRLKNGGFLQRDNGAVHVKLDNGGSMNFKEASLSVDTTMG